MKNILFIILGLSVASCLNQADKNMFYKSEAENYVKNLEQQKSIASTIDAYKNYFDIDDYQNQYGMTTNLSNSFQEHFFGESLKTPMTCQPFSKKYDINRFFYYMKNLLRQDIRLECVCSDYNTNSDQNIYKSDDCILYRRNLTYSPIAFFDYKRFLPNDSFIQTEKQFAFLYDIWKIRLEACQDNLDKEKKACKKLPDMTTKERDLCEIEAVKYYNEECVNIEHWLSNIRKIAPNIKSFELIYNKECDKEKLPLRYTVSSEYWSKCASMSWWFANKFGNFVRQKTNNKNY